MLHVKNETFPNTVLSDIIVLYLPKDKPLNFFREVTFYYYDNRKKDISTFRSLRNV